MPGGIRSLPGIQADCGNPSRREGFREPVHDGLHLIDTGTYKYSAMRGRMYRLNGRIERLRGQLASSRRGRLLPSFKQNLLHAINEHGRYPCRSRRGTEREEPVTRRDVKEQI